MPIFTDRHDDKGVTAADLAEAHRKDVAIQDQYGVKFLTYWFDERRGTTFCLVDAPDKESVQCVHRIAHGHIPGEVVEVALSAVEAFLGRIQDPEPSSGQLAPEMDSGRRAIMFTDMVGSTEMTARLGDRMATELIRAHDSIVRPCIGEAGGREVKHTGDGIMASFAPIVRAVDCAVAIQRRFQHYNQGNAEPIHVRIGIDCGEPIEDRNDLFGSTVQLAARLCSSASSDQVLVSENIHREHGAKEMFVKMKPRRLKGFAQPMRAFACTWDASPVADG